MSTGTVGRAANTQNVIRIKGLVTLRLERLDKEMTSKYLYFLRDYAGNLRGQFELESVDLSELKKEFNRFQNFAESEFGLDPLFLRDIKELELNITYNSSMSFVAKLTHKLSSFVWYSVNDFAKNEKENRKIILAEFVQGINSILAKLDQYSW